MTMKVGLLLTSSLLVLFAVLPARAEQVTFTPQNGLSGLSRGDGSLKLLLGRPRAFHVQSLGRSQSDGSFTLKQTVTFDGKTSETRRWDIHEVTTLNYTGTLSDAAGPVSGHTIGRRLFLKYRIKGPLVMHQTLALMPDGKTIDNVGRITLLGIQVGSVRETIRRGDWGRDTER